MLKMEGHLCPRLESISKDKLWGEKILFVSEEMVPLASSGQITFKNKTELSGQVCFSTEEQSYLIIPTPEYL